MALSISMTQDSCRLRLVRILREKGVDGDDTMNDKAQLMVKRCIFALYSEPMVNERQDETSASADRFVRIYQLLKFKRDTEAALR